MKKKIQLNLGSGIIVAKGFINVDKYLTLKAIKKLQAQGVKDAVVQRGSSFVQADICKLPFKDNFADYVETIDTVEHISFRKIQPAFNEIFRVLKPGGKANIMTTNFDALAREWTTDISGKEPGTINMPQYLDLMEVIYGNQIHAGEFHCIPFNPYFLGYLLQQAGFKISKIKMTIFPRGSRIPANKMKTQTWDKNALTRAEMILVEATK